MLESKKGAGEAQSRRLWLWPIPNSSLWEQQEERDHILGNRHFWKQLEAVGMTLVEQNT